MVFVPSCVVCYQCALKLNKISKLQSNVEKIRMDILHNLFGIDDNYWSSNDNCHQNSTGTPRHVQATEQFEPLDNVQQNSAGIPQNVQATERFEPPNSIQQDFTSTPQRVQATENVEPLDNFEQPFTGIPQSVQVTDQPAVEDNEPRHKRSKVTVSITSLLYISIFVFAQS